MFRNISLSIIIISIAISGCKTSTEDNSKSVDKENIPLYDKYSAKQIKRMNYSKSLRLGFTYYKNKKNRLALPFLKHATGNKKGKAHYYLGNVLMNLRQYKQAVDAYLHSYEVGFKRKDSIFNLACAYSLWNKPQLSLFALLINSRIANNSMTRINKDSDLGIFRKSKYYKQFLKDRHYFSKGITPETKADFINNMFFNKFYDDPEGIVSGTRCNFKRDGLVFFLMSQGGRKSVGSWKIDDYNKTLTLKIEKEWQTYDAPPHKNLSSIKNITDFNNTKFSEMTTYIIPFKNIRLKIKDISISFEQYKGWKYERVFIGNYKTDKISLIFGQTVPW